MKQGFTVKEYFSVFVVALTVGVGGAARGATLQFSQDSLTGQFSSTSVNFSDLPTVQVSSELALPAQVFLVPLGADETAADISTTATVIRMSEEPLAPVDFQITSSENHYDVASLARTILNGQDPVTVIDEILIDGKRYARVLAFPITVDTDGQQYFHPEISLAVRDRAVTPGELLLASSRPTIARNHDEISAGNALREYIIVTSESLIPALQDLARYRRECGYQTEIVAIEGILASYSGRDDAERLRNYLIDFHANGGEYVLLAGDETVLPVRYAYHQSNPLDTVVSIAEQQICDLYFADLTGDWNRDNDSTWGERLEDAADITAELVVGRLPFNTPEEFRTYTRNLVRYETAPGGDDPSYLGKAFFYSSDQMRDLNDGQHNRIAEAYPASFTFDTVSAVEAMRGDDPSPSNLGPAALTPVLQGGYGIINILSHGRVDGFVLKSASYNEWPKTLMLTEPNQGHGDFASACADNKPSFYYSLACDNAAFDSEHPDINISGNNMCQTLLSLPNGAVGFVGYTRWGWVGTSYLLQKAYFDSLFAHPDRSAAEALFAMKEAYYYYRDMAYGMNYFGDPVMRVYDHVPGKLTFVSEANSNGVTVRVSANNQPVPECTVIASLDGQIIAEAVTDGLGTCNLTLPAADANIYTLSLTRPGYTVSRGTLVGSIATDVDEDESNLPGTFALGQNYPNPFNPSTTIRFELPKRAQVQLTVYNLLGQAVTTLLSQEMSAGEHSVVWDGRDSRSNRVGSGIYLYRLQAEEFTQTKKMVLLP